MPSIDLPKTRVIAFVGPAGTGKSQRAQVVALENEVDYIIDDGLVIAKGRIMAGKSAKAEKNLVRAIRRALFQFPDHRKAVLSFLDKKRPRKLMIIATSISMAEKISRALRLPYPEMIIDITEVASPEEIIKARRERHEKGQHVIPASRTQIRKNFAGKLVGHLRGLFKSVDREDGERTIVRPPFSFYGELSIESSAVLDIVRHVLKSNPQVASIKDVRVRYREEAVSIEASLQVLPGKMDFRQIGLVNQKRVASAVSYFTGMDVEEVDIHIVEVRLR
ncbi:MAG: hypothetical protein QM441_10580 [Synergistota bacterium]|jgi:uncharacterized alkaline shock family protein YloU|nr:hypothetical protein [Synergistota bacterium]OPZ40119.1 MAG: hypothetical protein BWY99_01023 [Synergistetes bacterium ADurb.BinA166]